MQKEKQHSNYLIISQLTQLCLFSAFVFFLRRLGVELGKSVVYQEPNRGEAVILLSLTFKINVPG